MNEQRVPQDVVRYKTVLQKVLDSRPSGTRQRLASTLGTNRSFVSQISNPAYRVAIPVHHIETIFEVCRFSPDDRAAFLAAYDAAHPGQRAAAGGGGQRRTISITVPDLGSAQANRVFDEALRDVVRALTKLKRER